MMTSAFGKSSINEPASSWTLSFLCACHLRHVSVLNKVETMDDLSYCCYSYVGHLCDMEVH